MRRFLTFALLTLGSVALVDPGRAFDTADLPEVGYHLNGVAYWSGYPFGNGMAIDGRNWRDGPGNADFIPYMLDETTRNPQIDMAGNPQYLDPGQVLYADITSSDNLWHTPSNWPSAMLLDGHHVLDGRMTLTWKGTADIRLVYVESQVSGSATGLETDGTRVYLNGPGKATVQIHAIDTNDPPYEIRCWLPDPSNWDGASLVDQTFHPVLLDRLADADWKHIRFMDWGPVNNNPQQDWSDRRLPADAFQTGIINPRFPTSRTSSYYTGPAIETMVELCNAADKDLWICVPHMATDDYITRMAQAIRYGSDGVNPYTSPRAGPVHAPLAGHLNVFLEYSNEAWNWLFAQRHYADEQAALLGITAEQFNARQFSRCWQLAEAVLPTNRLHRVAAVWSAVTSYTQPFIDAFYDNPALLKPELLAVTTYFGNGIQNWVLDNMTNIPTNATPWEDPYWQSQQLQDDMGTAFDAWKHLFFNGAKWGVGTGPDGISYKGIPQGSMDIAYSRGLPVACYEGGPSIYTDSLDGGATEDDGVTLFMVSMNRDPRFIELYDLQLNYAKAQGLWSHMMFTDTSKWGKWGQWGHLEYLVENPTNSVKWQFMLDHMTEFSAINHLDEPVGAVPEFVTDAALTGEIDVAYSRTIVVTNGDGALSTRVVGSWLQDGMTFNESTLTFTGLVHEAGTNFVYIQAVDSDGDPAWREFALAMLPPPPPPPPPLILYEAFDTGAAVGSPIKDDPAWNDTDNDGNHGVVRDGLTFSNYITLGRAVATDGQETDYRSVTNLTYFEDYGTLYLSGMFRAAAPASWGGSSLVSLSLSSDTTAGRLAIGLTNGDVTDGSGPHDRIHAFAGSAHGVNEVTVENDVAVATDNLTAGTTYFVLARLAITDDVANTMDISLIVIEDGDAIPATEPTGWDAVYTGASYQDYAIESIWQDLDRLNVEQGNTPGTPGVANLADEFRLSRTYAGALPDPVAGPDPYDTWAALYNLIDDDALLDTDIEPDGLNNLMEYALDGNPTNDDKAAVFPDAFVADDSGSNYLYHVHNERTNDPALAYRVGTKTNLVIEPDWDTHGVSFVDASAVVGNFKSVTNRAGMLEPAKYIGLEVEKQPGFL